MKLSIAAALLSVALPAAELDRPSGNRTTPPTLDSVSPLGLARGTTTELTIEGLNLAKTSAIYFSDPGVTGKILRVKELPDGSDVRLGSNGTLSTVDLGPLPPRNQVTIEVDVSSKAEIGPVGFRLLTPLGTTQERRVLIEPYYGESADREPNDSPEEAVEAFLPTILTGAISKPGDVDYFKIQVKAGEQLTFENGAQTIGSSLQPVVAILSEDQAVLRVFGADGGMDTLWFNHRFEKAGTYYIRVSDYAQSGRGSNFYRIKVGSFPIVTRAYPLGIQDGQSRDEHLYGWNLNPEVVRLQGKPSEGYEDMLELRPEHAFNEVKLAVGSEPEVEAAQDNRTLEKAQPLSTPVTVNGRLEKPGDFAFYKFSAKKGQKLIVDVNARRLGSELDSFLEVLDAQGKRVERATVRATWETNITLNDQTSSSTGLRISSWSDLKPGDLVMIGNEIIRIERLPKGPDEDTFFEQFGGQRLAFFDTTTEAHAVDKPVYKIQLHPPGTTFSNNGLPLVHLYYQNDDGGPGYSKDSLIHFVAPADGEYIVKLRDIQGLGGENYAYRLTVREPRPDFRLAVNDPNPNVPVGGCVPITVTARRMDEFDGAIQVAVQDLPAGLTATPGLIQSGQVNSTMLLCASANARLDRAVALKITGKAQNITREANPDDHLKLIALMTSPDVRMTAETKELTIPQGGTGKITVSIQRQNEFAGRVPIDVRNLPPHVQVPDVGLNGILLNETENRRTFTLEALPDAKPGEQWIYVGGDIETRSNLPSVYAAPEPIKLIIVAK